VRVQCKTLLLSIPNNYSWISLQPVQLAVRRLKIIRFFGICVTTTFVPKIVIFKNMPNHGRNIDVLYYLCICIVIWHFLLFFLWILNLITTVIFTFYYKVLSFSFFLLFLFRYLSFVFLACSGASDTNAMVLDVANHIISISLNSQKLKIYQ
jgi:hypothetical protein